MNMTFIKGHKFGKRFEKGQIPWNKGTLGIMKPNKTSFKKGQFSWSKGLKNIFKHSEEFKQKKREAFTGKNNPRWNGNIKTCENCGLKITSRSMKVRRCSKCFHQTQIGENNSNWKGGVTKVCEKIRKSGVYMEWRRSILLRDNFTCLFCKKRGGKLNVDHFPKSFASIMHEYTIDSLEKAFDCNDLWNTQNGRTLCIECHKLTPTYLRNLIQSNG